MGDCSLLIGKRETTLFKEQGDYFLCFQKWIFRICCYHKVISKSSVVDFMLVTAFLVDFPVLLSIKVSSKFSLQSV